MPWFDTERFGDVTKRAPLIQPYNPGVTERLGNNTGQFAASKDVGKPVKLSGSTCVLCAANDVPYGYIESIEAGTSEGYSIGTVLCRPGHEILATDTAGSLAVGGIVQCGTAVVLGTSNPATGPNVVTRTGLATDTDRWIVVETYGSGAGRQVLIRKAF
jgi:hypothetical protein